jgi:hypothetical protein
METKPDRNLKVEKTLESAKRVQLTELPFGFEDRIINKLRGAEKQKDTVLYTTLLKVAAIVILLTVNIYTVKYFVNPNQPNTKNNPTISDFINDIQPNDSNEVTFEQLSNERQ